jgi:hypothetical protein
VSDLDQQTEQRDRRQPTNPKCRGKRHSPTEGAHASGCRCPETLAAHDQFLVQCRVERSQALSAWRVTGRCAARLHGTYYAYERVGCRCASSIEIYARRADRRSETQRLRRGSRPRQKDPTALRYPVGRLELTLMLTGGMPDKPNFGEMLVADIYLARRRVPDGLYQSRTPTAHEIADRLGVNERTLLRARADRRRLRAARTRRRLHDVKAKAARVAGAAERKQERARAMASRRDERVRAWRVHCRTMRRLWQSQERAKRVALAIERRSRIMLTADGAAG